ncbi:MAG: hypothetical protein AAGF95_13565 [Chloroflexota bacterium]
MHSPRSSYPRHLRARYSHTRFYIWIMVFVLLTLLLFLSDVNLWAVLLGRFSWIIQ